MKWNNECKALSAMIGISKVDNNGSYHPDPPPPPLPPAPLYWRLLVFKSCFDPFPTNEREWAELTRKLLHHGQPLHPRRGQEGYYRIPGTRAFLCWRVLRLTSIWLCLFFLLVLQPLAKTVPSAQLWLRPLHLWPGFLFLQQVPHSGFIAACPKISSKEDHTHTLLLIKTYF